MWFFRLISQLPFWCLYGISDFLFIIIFYVFRYRRGIVLGNIKRCFPHKPAREIQNIERAFYRHLCDVVVETIKLISISPEELKKRIRHENPGFADAIIASGSSYVAMASHMANWEWLLAGNALYLNGKIDAVYKPLHNTFFDRLMLFIRSRFACFPVPSDQVLRQEIARKSVPKGIAMACDQTPGPEGSAVIDFMGVKTLFFQGPPKLAIKLGFPLFYAGIRKESRGRYVLFVENMEHAGGNNSIQILEEFAGKLERDIRIQPALWLWSHKRWKHSIRNGTVG